MSDSAALESVFSEGASRGAPLITWRHGPFLFGFGKKDLSMELLQKTYPELKWAHLKQTHSCTVVESSRASDGDRPDARSAANTSGGSTSAGAFALTEADAHFSFENGLGLIIKTADCLPVLIAASSSTDGLPGGKPHAICAIHAGWRGVNTDIVQNAVRTLLEKGYAPTRMTVAIGPHIRKESFEVGLDVARDLKAAAKRAGVANPQSVIYSHKSDATKRMIDLETIVRHQLHSFQIPPTSIHSLAIDTLTSTDWASFRRNGANAGRNLSFVVKF